MYRGQTGISHWRNITHNKECTGDRHYNTSEWKFHKWPLQTNTQSQIVAYWAAIFAAKKLAYSSMSFLRSSNIWATCVCLLSFWAPGLYIRAVTWSYAWRLIIMLINVYLRYYQGGWLQDLPDLITGRASHACTLYVNEDGNLVKSFLWNVS